MLSGIPAGLVAGGAGTRLAMRIVALTAASADQGKLTEAEAVVGEITFGGTLFLLIAGSFAGIAGAVLYAALRPWLRRAGIWRGLLFGLFLAATPGFGLINGAGDDFARFGYPALNIAMFGSLFVLFGLLVAPLFDTVYAWLGRRPMSPVLLLPILLCFPALGSIPIITQDGRALLLLLYCALVLPPLALLVGMRPISPSGRFSSSWMIGAIAATVPFVIGVALSAATIAGVFD